jgi:flagellar hook-length control protein FliK
MTEAVKSNEQLADVMDATKRSWRRDRNNLAAGGQIQMQFSSIMRTFVDSPEKMMEVATAQSKVQAEDRSQPAERDDFRSRVREQRRASGREVEGNDRPAEHRPERTKQTEKPKAQARDTSNDEPKTEASADTKTDAPAETAETKVGKSFQDEILDAQQTIIQTAPLQQQTTEVAADPALHVQHQQAAAQLDQGAQTVVAGALTDKDFSRVGEDLHDAANAVVTASKAPQATGQTAASSLKDQQESDLANRLSGMGQFQIQVDNATSTPKNNSNPFNGLNANVNFGQFDGLDTASQTPTVDPLNSNSAGTGTEQKTQSTHANQPIDMRNSAASAQDVAATFGAAMRAQAAMTGQPGAADVKPNIAPAEAIQSIGAAAPAGPSQLSQTAKANPTTAAHQPEKAKEQTAAEQIAVKIRQAVGEGTDKINIKLNPHELGRVEVRLEVSKDGSITATVLAERQDTLDILQKDARGLERALNDAGLRADATSLSFGLRGEGQRQADVGRDRRNGSNNRNDERTATGRIEFGDKAGVAKSAAYQRTLGADSGVDIRV